jgi:hypothetical protein
VTRAWDEWAAAVFDVVPGPTLLLILLLAAGLAGALWYTYPAWIPRRWPRWPRRRRRVRAARPAKKEKPKREKIKKVKEAEPVVTAAVTADLSLADRLAAEGRFAEAIRQRLRDTIRELVAAGVVAPQPGWTAVELAAVAAEQRPAVAGPLGRAVDVFSEIWYGDRPAGREQDDHMRTLTGLIHAELTAAAR